MVWSVGVDIHTLHDDIAFLGLVCRRRRRRCSASEQKQHATRQYCGCQRNSCQSDDRKPRSDNSHSRSLPLTGTKISTLYDITLVGPGGNRNRFFRSWIGGRSRLDRDAVAIGSRGVADAVPAAADRRRGQGDEERGGRGRLVAAEAELDGVLGNAPSGRGRKLRARLSRPVKQVRRPMARSSSRSVISRASARSSRPSARMRNGPFSPLDASTTRNRRALST